MRYLIILILIPLIQLGLSFLGKEFIAIQHSFTAIHGFVLLQQICSVFLPTYLLFRKKRYLPKEEYTGVNFSEILHFAVIGILLQLIGVALNLPLNVLLRKLGCSPPSALPIAKTFLQFMIQSVVVCLVPAVFEEVLFRRMIFLEIKKKSSIAAILFSALFFSMAHIDFYNVPATLFIGCFLGIVRITGAPLILCITAHFFANFSACVLNILLKYPILERIFSLSLPFWVFLSFIIFIKIFPKKKELSEHSFINSKSFIRYIRSLLMNPLFYVFCILFVTLGVNRL